MCDRVRPLGLLGSANSLRGEARNSIHKKQEKALKWYVRSVTVVASIKDHYLVLNVVVVVERIVAKANAQEIMTMKTQPQGLRIEFLRPLDRQ